MLGASLILVGKPPLNLTGEARMDLLGGIGRQHITDHEALALPEAPREIVGLQAGIELHGTSFPWQGRC